MARNENEVRLSKMAEPIQHQFPERVNTIRDKAFAFKRHGFYLNVLDVWLLLVTPGFDRRCCVVRKTNGSSGRLAENLL